ncbi:MAG: tRNA (adenine-N1)-methyltransferase [Actinomycetia bacterium]|nr:tRNA (adenine-N1)-methyltransferase [Actinomycetes bacterium]
MTDTPSAHRPFVDGERVLLVDSKQRRYLINLAAGTQFQSHAGVVPHDEIIGRDEGIELRTASNAKYLALRPTLVDHVLKMPRGAQVIYPKDIGPILILADIFPGARVLESGIGSGALSTALLRAGAHVTGYEIRDDFADVANTNVSNFLGEKALERYDIHLRSIYQGIDGGPYDRIVLDLPEPWHVVEHIEDGLIAGGIILAYTPSIVQVTRFREALDNSSFTQVETTEVLHRGWYVNKQAVRPDHRMVAHTGFLTHARYLGT